MRGTHSDNPRRLNRPAIWADYEGKGVVLIIRTEAGRFRVPHDDLLAWVGEHTAALTTMSWTDRGHYSWPRPSQEMLDFLRPYAQSAER